MSVYEMMEELPYAVRTTAWRIANKHKHIRTMADMVAHLQQDISAPTKTSMEAINALRVALNVQLPEVRKAEEAKRDMETITCVDEAFLAAARPLMDYLLHNHHPHMTVIVYSMTAELVEGQMTAKRKCTK